MPNAENKPDQQPPHLPEPLPFPAIIRDETHTVMISKRDETVYIKVQKEGAVIFSAALYSELPAEPITEAAISLAPVVPTDQLIEAASTTAIHQEQSASQQTGEKEQPVRLRGRIGTDIRRKDSPTGGKMAVFSFGEHPSKAIWSYSNTLPVKPEKDTIWWPVAAFDDDIALLDEAAKGKAYDIECFPRSWKETIDGKVKTVHGMCLVGILPVVRRTHIEPLK